MFLRDVTDELSLQGAWAEFRSLGALPGWLHKAHVGATPHEDIFHRGNLRFIRYHGAKSETHPIVIIPSLINRHYVLDLLPKRSLIEAFIDAGFETYLMAWGHPPAEDRFLTPEDLFKRRILRAIEIASQETGRVHLVGHCLGGTLAAIAALLSPEKIASLSLLTAPLNFENSGPLGEWAKAPGLDVDALVEAYGNIPASLLQTSFQFLKPSMPLVKLAKLVANRKDEDFLISFLAMEMWANDSIGFPGLCYKFLIQELYQKNQISLAGQRLNLADLQMPVWDVVAVDDHIVPPCTRLPFENSRTTRVDLEGGHIGALIGSRARRHFWPTWIQWLKEA